MSGSIYDPTTLGLLGLAQGFGTALAQPRKMPFGAVLGAGAGGLAQGMLAGQESQLRQQQVNAAQLQNQMLSNYVNMVPSVLGQGQPQQQSAATPQPNQPTGPMFAGAEPQFKAPAVQFAVATTAKQAGVDPQWATRVAAAETGGEADPYSAVSSKGAIGPMQLMPGTAQDLGVDPNDPNANIQGGVTYLNQMLKRYGGNKVLATAAYNAGPQAVDDYVNGKGQLPPETISYVGKVFGQDPKALFAQTAAIPGQTVSFGDTRPASVTVPNQQQTQGMQPVPMDDQARSAVRQLIQMRNLAMLAPNGTGWRAVAGIQSQLDNIAGPGGIVDPMTGNVYAVPGALEQRQKAAYAAGTGKAAAQAQEPVTLAPGATLLPHGELSMPGGAAGSTAPVGGAQNLPGGGYQAPPESPDVAFNKAEGTRESAIAGKMPDVLTSSQQAITQIDSVQQKLAAATQGGLPSGYFTPALSEAAAAAKALGIDTKPLGINPQAVSDIQAAHKNLAIISGEILRDIMGPGQRQITNKDIASFINATPGIETDPQALQKILQWAKSQAVYNNNMAHDFYASGAGTKMPVRDWQAQWFQKNGGGPVFNPVTGDMEQPGQSQAAGAQAQTPSGSGNGAGGQIGGFRDGQTATNPKTGARMVFRNGQWQPL